MTKSRAHAWPRVRRTSKRKLPTISEDQIQRAVFNHIRARGAKGLVAFHPANGERRDKITGARLKALGVLPGVSDVILLHDGRFYALELKRENGRASEPQLAFVAAVNAVGGFAAIAYGLDEAIAVLEAWELLQSAIRMVA